MTDILKIALDRRAELHEEVARIDEFIRMADSLLRKLETQQEEDVEHEQTSGYREPAGPREVTPGVTRMNLMRRGPSAVAS